MPPENEYREPVTTAPIKVATRTVESTDEVYSKLRANFLTVIIRTPPAIDDNKALMILSTKAASGGCLFNQLDPVTLAFNEIRASISHRGYPGG
jgi:hypothetical protein